MSNVNHPAHYQGKHECIEIMRAMFGDESVKGFCRCNAYKYRFRAGRKEGQSAEQDIKKAEWYEEYLISMDRGNTNKLANSEGEALIREQEEEFE